MIEIRTLDTVSFGDGLRAWNDGFQGYPYAGAMEMSAWLSHIAQEGLQPELSLIAYDGGRPVGCVLNGMREGADGSVAYNGGTGVSREYRGQGLGRRLIDASIDLYRRRGAAVATLEVVTTNAPALALYRSVGYEVTDRLSVLSCEHRLELRRGSSPYLLDEADPPTLKGVPFYRENAPWQCHWQSLKDGRVLRLHAPEGRLLGYALLRRSWLVERAAPVVGLYQMGFDEGCDAPAVARILLERAFEGASRTYAMNIQTSDPVTLAALLDMGFLEQVAQFQMRLNL